MKNETTKPLQGSTEKRKVRNNIIVATLLFIALACLSFAPIAIITELENFQYWKEVKLIYLVSIVWAYIMYVVIRLLTYHANHRIKTFVEKTIKIRSREKPDYVCLQERLKKIREMHWEYLGYKQDLGNEMLILSDVINKAINNKQAEYIECVPDYSKVTQ